MPASGNRVCVWWVHQKGREFVKNASWEQLRASHGFQIALLTTKRSYRSPDWRILKAKNVFRALTAYFMILEMGKWSLSCCSKQSKFCVILVHRCLATWHTLQICIVQWKLQLMNTKSALEIGDIHSEKLCFLVVGTICSASTSVCDTWILYSESL